ncbi:TPA: hypothetical protein N2G46_002500 [Salmonella enterica]|nr:hypothetical protein [Salmonella enterica]EHM1751043.1 hypothetical protein [Salmonella enterica subsp. salamae serovar 40:c:e,n,x,z15]EIU8982421.1 hypothetical protein [Salmonella enterica]HCL5348960.1 hypothetical protein [Salmonella enterica]
MSIQETKKKGAVLPSQTCQNTTFWCSFIYSLAVKVMLLADRSSQYKKIPSNKNVMQFTIKQGSENICNTFENPPKPSGKSFRCDNFPKSASALCHPCLKCPERNDKHS